MAKVLLFGRLGDLAGWRERDMQLPDRLSALRDALLASAPELAPIAAAEIRVAVDGQLVRGDAPLEEAREVAFLPPFSGG
ncbi:MAG: MoaD/ThiS family protein [Acetobacteraceae bacterium]|nr:MoaD/ThiS family protein [Acetobacteraceae bacterium]